MSDEALARYESRRDILSLCLALDPTCASVGYPSEIAWGLVWITYHNPHVLLAHVPAILSNKEMCLRLVRNIPPAYRLVREYWEQFWEMEPTKRAAIELYVVGRINLYYSMITERWIEETAHD